MASTSHYKTLNVPRNADLATIKKAYRKQIRATHPDRFEAELAKLRNTGNSAQIYALERKLAQAQQKAQRLNEAYAVLSDPARRREYDLTLAAITNAQITQERYERHTQSGEEGRRSVKQRSHHDPNNPYSPPRPNDSAVPWAIMGGLLVVLIVGFGLLSNFLNVIDHTPFTTYVPRESTAQGVVSANDLQATTSARRATAVRRTEVAVAPTSTPRSIEANLSSARALMDVGQYRLALEPLDLAISQATQDPALYLMRGEVYAQLVEEEESALANAIGDYTFVLTLDASSSIAYRERGLLFYMLYVRDALPEDAERALADFEMYIELNGAADDEIAALVEVLQSARN